MVEESKPIRRAPVQIWGLRSIDHQRIARADKRKGRECAECRVPLSRYNSTPICGACRVRQIDEENARILAMERHPSKANPWKDCATTDCYRSFRSSNPERTLCQSCIQKAASRRSSRPHLTVATPPPDGRCLECQAELPDRKPGVPGGNRKYCSDSCRYRASKRRWKQRRDEAS